MRPEDFMQPASAGARAIAHFGSSVLVAFVVAAAIVWLSIAWIALRRCGSFDSHAPVDLDDGRGWIVVAGLLVPGVVFILLWGMMFRPMHRAPMQGASMHGAMAHPLTASAPAEIRITGRQWWFDAEYLDARVDRAVHVPTEIHIPVGRPVQVELVARDVIHSFWVPRLQGKVDLVPGQPNRVVLQAEKPGVYDGQCAEFCGVEHARMRLQVVAQPEPEYRAWLDAQRNAVAEHAADVPASDGEQVFMQAACPLCHTVRGTSAHGLIGPDLTHVGGRRTIAGGSLENDTANLSAWVTDAQSLKPGSHMPSLRQMNGPQLRALVGYLQSLQ